MRLSFHTGVRIAAAGGPLLEEILKECEVECRVTVGCSAQGDDLDLHYVELDDFSVEPPDHHSAVKAMFLMPDDLRREIEEAAANAVEDGWDRYYEEAYAALVDLREAAADERYESMRDR